jgi:hypothetical protein
MESRECLKDIGGGGVEGSARVMSGQHRKPQP